jgi:hypothetical protein
MDIIHSCGFKAGCSYGIFVTWAGMHEQGLQTSPHARNQGWVDKFSVPFPHSTHAEWTTKY